MQRDPHPTPTHLTSPHLHITPSVCPDPLPLLQIKSAIVDKNARIGRQCRIVNVDGVQEATRDEDGYVIRDGIVVIIKDATIPDGTVI